jgi:glycosyltransferase involved in cell wall biosynthesis
VLAQSYPAVEIIVIDDGSTDSSGEIAQRLPVRYLRQENRGLCAARNAGIRKSNGNYLLFLDADDRLKPKAIEYGVRALDAHPDCALAVGDHVFIAGDGSYLGNSVKVAAMDRHFEALLKSNFIEMISSVLFRRSIFEQVGGFNPCLRVAEDYDLYLRIARVQPIYCHTAIVAEYRKHGGNTSLNSELMLTTTLQVLKAQERYVRSDAGRLLAYREGIHSWRRQYGRQLVMELATSCAARRGDRLRHKLMILAGYYPQGLLMFALLRLMPAVGQRSRCSVRGASYGNPSG